MFHELRINTARQERYFSMTFVRSHSLRLIKELCLISFIFQRTGCTRRSSTERGETQTIFITYATDSEFQYLNYNLRGEMNEKKSCKMKFAVHCLGGIALLFAHRVVFRRHQRKQKTENCAHCCFDAIRMRETAKEESVIN